MGDDIAIRRAGAGDLDAATTITARAFFDDPMFNYFYPNPFRQHVALAGFMAGGVHDAYRHGEVWLAEAGGTISGSACWLPPGVRPPGNDLRALRQARHAALGVLRSPRRGDAMALMNEMSRHHPTYEHWYLAILAADPMFHGRGSGSALLRPMLERADAQGMPVYLETQKESNLAYYGRFGFEVDDVLRVRRCPPLWTMVRRATG
jgi:GNAT superfamily N-acetyltransferase